MNIDFNHRLRNLNETWEFNQTLRYFEKWFRPTSSVIGRSHNSDCFRCWKGQNKTTLFRYWKKLWHQLLPLMEEVKVNLASSFLGRSPMTPSFKQCKPKLSYIFSDNTSLFSFIAWIASAASLLATFSGV